MKHEELKPKAYICGTDWQHELQTPGMLENCKITPNIDFALEWPCVKDNGCPQCGLAEIEIRFVRWIKEPTI